MESLYHQTNRLVQEVQQGFASLETCPRGNPVNNLENDLQARIDQITSNCERLDILVNKEPPARRQNAKLRVKQLKYDCQHLQAALRIMQHRRYTKEQELQEREELLSRKFTTNDQSETSIFMDHTLQQNTSLHNAHNNMDELIGSGGNILTNLRDQRTTLKGAHKKVLDIANSLGMSTTVLRLIERRGTQDKYILFAGMIITCIVIFFVIRYVSS